MQDGGEVTQSEGAIRIVSSGFSLGGVLNVVGSLVPLGACVGLAASGARGLGVVLALPFLGIVYWQLARLVDRRTLTLDHAITITFGPLPLPSTGPFPVRDVVKIVHVVRRGAFGVHGHTVSAKLPRMLLPLVPSVVSEARAKELSELLAAHVAKVRGVVATPPAAAIATRAAPARPTSVDGAVRSFAGAFDVDAKSLLATIPGLGPISGAELSWSSAGDVIGLVVPWTPSSDASFKVLSISDRTQSKTFPLLRAKYTPALATYGTVAGKPGALATSFAIRGTIDPASLLAGFVGPTIVKPSAGAAMGEAWTELGVACDRVDDVAQPPVGPNLWRFSGSIAPGALVAASEALARRLTIRDTHRAVAPRLATGRSLRIGLESSYESLLPHAWLTTEHVSLDEARALVTAALGDAARAERVIRAFAGLGTTACTVSLRIAREDPIRVIVQAPL